MKTFQTSGRLGDIVYQMYTVKSFCARDSEQAQMLIDLEHHKEPRGAWNLDMAYSIAKLLNYQDYISNTAIVTGEQYVWPTDINLVDAENAPADPKAFPEWRGPNWPGNIHLAKRYAHHFGFGWKPGDVWMTAPQTKKAEVVVHAPLRRMTDKYELYAAINMLRADGVKVTIIAGHDWTEWENTSLLECVTQPANMLEAADYINSAKVFLGAVSSCHAIAEALGKPRFVQQAADCDNVNSTLVLNGMSAKDITLHVEAQIALTVKT